MLWMKNWLETRWRLLSALAVFSFIIIAGSQQFGGSPQPNSLPAEQRLGVTLSTFSLFFVMQALLLAGAGIKTQTPFQVAKGLHGSMHFTLSLPVSRLRLLAARTGMGILELLVAIFVGAGGLALIMSRQFPERAFPVLDSFEYAFTLFACLTACFSISVVLATFLDDMWQMWGSLIVIVALRGLSAVVKIPENFDPFRATSSASPFITHAIPWGAVGVSLAFAVALWLLAARIVQTRDY